MSASSTCAGCSANGRRRRPIPRATTTASSAEPARTPAGRDGRKCGNVTASAGSTREKHADLDAAFDQLGQYTLALEKPPLLIVSDIHQFRIPTNSVSKTLEFGPDDLVDASVQDKLK